VGNSIPLMGMDWTCIRWISSELTGQRDARRGVRPNSGGRSVEEVSSPDTLSVSPRRTDQLGTGLEQVEASFARSFCSDWVSLFSHLPAIGGGQHPRLPPFGGKPADLVGVSATSNKLEAAVLAPDVSRWL
jgi:hypothetical protein